MFRNNRAGVAGTLVVFALVQPTFAEHKFPDYPTHRASDCAVKAERAGLLIGIQPMEDRNEQKYYFNTELTPKGFVPVYMVLENSSSGDSFLFDKTTVKYGLAGPGGPRPKTLSVGNIAAVDSIALAANLMLPLAGAIFAFAVFSKANDVQRNILRNEVQSKTLSPGISMNGFLYVPVPKKGPRQKVRLQVPITRAGKDETTVLEFDF